MSGGTPVGIYMRRHSQGYASSGDDFDIEDDACSRPRPVVVHPVERNRGWVEVLENLLWIVSAVFVVYYGDGDSNLIYLMWHDDRIKRLPLYLGMFGVGLNIVIFFYTSMLAWKVKRFDEKLDLSSVSTLPFITLLGLISFCLFSVALWPIWSFLTLPLVFTLFMACMVIFPYIMFRTLRPQNDLLWVDQAFWNSSEKQY